MINFAASLDGLVRIVKRKLEKIQYRPRLIDSCLAETGLKSNRGDPVHYAFKLVSGSLLIRDVEVQAAACRDRADQGLQLRGRGRI